MNIDITPKNKIHEFYHIVHKKLDDILFSIVLKLPKSFITVPIMNWLDRYIDKCIKKIQEDITRQKWDCCHLEKAIEEIHAEQDKKKAP